MRIGESRIEWFESAVLRMCVDAPQDGLGGQCVPGRRQRGSCKAGWEDAVDLRCRLGRALGACVAVAIWWSVEVFQQARGTA